MVIQSEKLQKVLFIRFGAIGDIIHTTLSYQSLKKCHKNIDIDYLTTDIFKILLENEKDLRKIITLTSKDYKNFISLFNTGKKLSKEKYDLVINLQPSFKTFFLSLLINPKKVLVYNKRKKETNNNKSFSAVKSFFETIRTLIPDYPLPSNLKLTLNDEQVNWVKEVLKENNITDYIAIIPGVSYTRLNKLWPKDYWKSLLEYVCNKKNYKVIILGSNTELELCRDLETVSNNILNLCNKTTLSQSAAILSLAKLVIGSDTGPTHIATAVNNKVIGLYGPTSINRVGLYGNNHLSLSGSDNCLCCELKVCNKINKNEVYSNCMKSLSVETVIENLGI